MKTKQVSYSMQRAVPQPPGMPKYANDRAEVTIELEDGDTPEAAIAAARAQCAAAIFKIETSEIETGFKALLAQEIAGNAWPLFTSGQLRPIMDQAFPLAQAAEAHARMEAGAHIGKIVLKVG